MVCPNPQLQNKISSIEISETRLTSFKCLIWVPLVDWEHIIKWYQISLLHAGETHMLNTIGLHFSWQGIWKQFEDVIKTCDECQKCKITAKRNYGKIPLKSALHKCKPCSVIHVDCLVLGQSSTIMKSPDRSLSKKYNCSQFVMHVPVGLNLQSWWTWPSSMQLDIWIELGSVITLNQRW